MSRAGTTRLSFLSRLRRPGSTHQWTEFHQRYGELLFSYARRLGASHERAEDIVQEVELAVFKAMAGFRHRDRKGCFRAYLRAAVIHAVGRGVGQDRRREAPLDPQTLENLANNTAPSDAEWEREQYLDRIRRALRLIAGEFEPATMEAFRMHVLANCAAADTAKQLGISRDSVYQAKSRIVRRLRECVESLDSEAEL